jgi:hypothetical protein
MQTVGEKGHEDVGLDALVGVMKDRPQGQVALEIAKGSFDFGEQNVLLPEQCGILSGKIGAEQVVPLMADRGAQFLPAPGKPEGLRIDLCWGRGNMNLDKARTDTRRLPWLLPVSTTVRRATALAAVIPADVSTAAATDAGV